MPQPYVLIDPCLPADRATALVDALRALPSLPMYVQQPVTEGLGAGLVRRHDALFNYVKGKSASGHMEDMEAIAARTNLFRGVLAEGSKVHDASSAELLYEHEPFLAAAEALTGLPHVVPDMMYVNVLLPGQELATHTDTPEYRGLSKAKLPEWFLVVMHHSGLFEDWRVRIAGGVTFLQPPRAGGAFVLYPQGADGAAVALPPDHNTSVMLDADALFHGVDRVGGPDAAAPPVRPGMTLHPVDGGGWEVHDGERVVATYGPGEVRTSVQWKAYCFPDEAAQRRFADHSDDLTVEQVVDRLLADLRSRGLVGDERPDDTSLALLLMSTYIAFPEAC